MYGISWLFNYLTCINLSYGNPYIVRTHVCEAGKLHLYCLDVYIIIACVLYLFMFLPRIYCRHQNSSTFQRCITQYGSK